MAKWTAKKLKNAVDDYFAGIRRMAPVKEPIPTGRRDSHGHEIYEMVEMKNEREEVVMAEEWILPPSIPDLLDHIGVKEEEWGQIKGDSSLREIALAAEKKVERYLRRELLTRPNKAIKGVVLTLQKDFGFGGVVEEAPEGGTLEQLLGVDGE